MSGIRASRVIRYALLACACLGVIFLFLLATASANTALFARSYDLLLVLNGTMVALLMGVVGYQLLRLRKHLKAGVFGSRLAARLVLFFALVAVLPGALLYGVSWQFLGKSIESWFDVRVDRALEGGLNLARGSLDYPLKEVTNKATQLALTLQEAEPGGMAARLNRASEQAQRAAELLREHHRQSQRRQQREQERERQRHCVKALQSRARKRDFLIVAITRLDLFHVLLQLFGDRFDHLQETQWLQRISTVDRNDDAKHAPLVGYLFDRRISLLQARPPQRLRRRWLRW